MPDEHAIVIPQETVNDDFVILVRWLTQDGERVTVGSALAEIETSKTMMELAAEHDGYLHHALAAGQQVAVGSAIGLITSDAMPVEAAAGGSAGSALAQEQSAQQEALPSPTPAVRFSQKARELIEQHGLKPELFAGRTLVREQDVQALLEERAVANQRPATPRGQAAIAEVVPLSPRKRTEIRYLAEGQRDALPSSVSVLVATQALDARIAARAGVRRLNYLDYVVAAVAAKLPAYRELNAFLSEEGINYYAELNIGIAMNMSEGLVVPIIHHAADYQVEEISRLIGDFAMSYLREELTEEQLTGGTFTITDLSGAGAFHVVPLLNRRQSAILALGLDRAVRDPRLTLTLTFDHRISEGRQVAEFLHDVKELLEAGETPALEHAASDATTSIVCSNCFNTLERLQEEQIADYMLQIVKGDGTTSYLCLVCLMGLNS